MNPVKYAHDWPTSLASPKNAVELGALKGMGEKFKNGQLEASEALKTPERLPKSSVRRGSLRTSSFLAPLRSVGITVSFPAC